MSNKIIDVTGLQRFFDKLKLYFEDLFNSKQDTLVSGNNIKTLNGESLLGSGDIVLPDANVKAIDTGDVLDDVNVEYATKTYIDELIGDINSVLESIINKEEPVTPNLITFTIQSNIASSVFKTYTAEEGMTWEEFLNSDYDKTSPSSNKDLIICTYNETEYISVFDFCGTDSSHQYYSVRNSDKVIQKPSDLILSNHVYMFYDEK